LTELATILSRAKINEGMKGGIIYEY